jgi:copper homeostasis protein
MTRLEVACFSYQSACSAIALGAHRIEFASSYTGGGITPNFSELKNLCKQTEVPVHVLIRCRLGNFVYSEAELFQMQHEIEMALEAGAAGLVFGCLDANNEIDIQANQFLLSAAKNTPCTFHRAFDIIPNYGVGLNQLMDMGFKAVLTSGSPLNAWDGKDTLAQLLVQAEKKIAVICGGGIRSKQLQALLEITKTKWIHAACINSQDESLDENELSQMLRILKQQL